MTDPVSAGTAPVAVELKAGERVVWCSCGRSATQPLCDGSHKGTGLKPVVLTAEQDGTVWLCTCKKTKTPPFCDGSHNGL